MRILIVEDDRELAGFVAKGLRENTLTVDLAYDGGEAISMARTGIYDVIVLDIMLPERSGFDVIRDLRADKIETPIICLTARNQVEDKVAGLNLGADDYLPKPFEFPELLARIRALSRRSADMVPTKLCCGDMELDPVTRRVRRAGCEIELTAKEFALLEFLMRRAGRTVTRTSILDNVWDMNYDSLTNVVDVLVNRLRRKVDHPFAEHLIETVRGVGYRMKPGEEQT
jgi:DNA-binding response OmpR family regulator